MSTRKKAIVLYSGGLDSTTCVAIAHSQGFQPVLLSFLYGQRHDNSMGSLPEEFCTRFGIEDHFQLGLPEIGKTSSLVGGAEVPKGKDPRAPGIPNTYVPARNLIFLSFACSIAEEIDARDIFMGVNQLDWSGYPDCRDEFVAAFEEAAFLGTRAGVEGQGFTIHRPLIVMTKKEIVETAQMLSVDFRWTFSCYDPQYREVSVDEVHGYTQTLACGTCDACQLRLEGFRQAGLEDPIPYLPDLNLLG